MTWEAEVFTASLTALNDASRSVYARDLAAFRDWVERGAISDPRAVDRRLIRRYLAYLDTRRYARRTIARKASVLRRYFDWARRRGAWIFEDDYDSECRYDGPPLASDC